MGFLARSNGVSGMGSGGGGAQMSWDAAQAQDQATLLALVTKYNNSLATIKTNIQTLNAAINTLQGLTGQSQTAAAALPDAQTALTAAQNLMDTASAAVNNLQAQVQAYQGLYAAKQLSFNKSFSTLLQAFNTQTAPTIDPGINTTITNLGAATRAAQKAVTDSQTEVHNNAITAAANAQIAAQTPGNSLYNPYAAAQPQGPPGWTLTPMGWQQTAQAPSWGSPSAPAANQYPAPYAPLPPTQYAYPSSAPPQGYSAPPVAPGYTDPNVALLQQQLQQLQQQYSQLLAMQQQAPQQQAPQYIYQQAPQQTFDMSMPPPPTFDPFANIPITSGEFSQGGGGGGEMFGLSGMGSIADDIAAQVAAIQGQIQAKLAQVKNAVVTSVTSSATPVAGAAPPSAPMSAGTKIVLVLLAGGAALYGVKKSKKKGKR